MRDDQTEWRFDALSRVYERDAIVDGVKVGVLQVYRSFADCVVYAPSRHARVAHPCFRRGWAWRAVRDGRPVFGGFRERRHAAMVDALASEASVAYAGAL